MSPSVRKQHEYVQRADLIRETARKLLQNESILRKASPRFQRQQAQAEQGMQIVEGVLGAAVGLAHSQLPERSDG